MEILENHVLVTLDIEEVRVTLCYSKDDNNKKLILLPGHAVACHGEEKMDRPTTKGLEEAKSKAKIALERNSRLHDYIVIN